MITNKNMSNIDLLNKLVQKSIELSHKESVSMREYQRNASVYAEILSRMGKDKEVMTNKHPLWNRFCNMLYFRLTYEPCDAETLTQSENILRKYFSNIDVEKSLEYFRNHGGFCDCEVLMNVG